MLKKIYICWVAVLFSASLSGQVPGTFNYQAVLRDASGNIRVNANVSMEISILQGSATGKVVYSELYSLATNAFGLVSLEIGSKNPTNFAGISWANGPYFIQISVDGILMGTSQLLSVPYALYASTSGSSIPGPKGDQGIPGPQGDKGDKGDAGINGKTAYQQWLDLGNTGTESDFIASLKGVKGDPGVQGIQGLQGLKGDKGDAGINGKTAYQQWLDLGNTGTESNFIASLKGVKGDPGLQGIPGVQGLKGDKGDAGINGKTAYQQWLDLGNTGTESDFIASLKGIKGDPGVQGIQGLQGLKGDKGDAGINGKTAYQQWLDLGNTGTESNFIASLKGIKGDPGLQGLQGIQGVQGLKGDKGDAGINGKTAYQQWLDLGNTGTESDFIASLKGIKGDQGVQGIQGVQGLKGDQGVQGIQGLKGDQGDPGVAFDNTQVLTDKTWTSSMINSSLSLKANIVNVYSKTNMQTAGQAQLHWNNITNKPTLFDGTWSSLTGKPSTLAGYGITDAAALGHIHNNATSSISGFMSFGDKMKLDTLRNYTHPATHDWSILINTPFNISSPIGGQLLKYNTTTGKWENWTPNYLSVENQQLSLTNNQLTISGAGGNTISFTNWDTDKTDDVVITGNQTIAGNKTFSGSIIANNTILANNGVNANNKIISNIAAPVANTDAVPKMYVDSLVTSLNLKIQVLQGVPVNQLMTAGATPAQLITAGAKVSDIVAAGGTVNGLTGTAIDLDGNTFKWIGIGNQVWMAENLKSIHYRNGDPIPNVTDITAWASLTTGAYCNYNNDISNVGLYGRLYNNYTVMDSRNVSPIGWHVPSKTEFLALEAALGGDTLIGGRMKEVGTLHWHTPNVGATNSSKFLGLPSGNRHDDGTFNYMTICGCFQSSTEYEFDSTKSYHFHLLFWRAILESVYYSKTYGLSIRCIKD